MVTEIVQTADLASILTVTGSSQLSPQAFSLASIMSSAGALILGRFTGTAGALTLPMNYIILFVGAVVANWLLAGYELPLGGDLHRLIVATVIGMFFGACTLLWLMRVDNSAR
jgi:uncharacterized membrane protein YeaQ/YmgE (transglycosylase-associated protein family)